MEQAPRASSGLDTYSRAAVCYAAHSVQPASHHRQLPRPICSCQESRPASAKRLFTPTILRRVPDQFACPGSQWRRSLEPGHEGVQPAVRPATAQSHAAIGWLCFEQLRQLLTPRPLPHCQQC